MSTSGGIGDLGLGVLRARRDERLRVRADARVLPLAPVAHASAVAFVRWWVVRGRGIGPRGFERSARRLRGGAGATRHLDPRRRGAGACRGYALRVQSRRGVPQRDIHRAAVRIPIFHRVPAAGEDEEERRVRRVRSRVSRAFERGSQPDSPGVRLLALGARAGAETDATALGRGRRGRWGC